MWKLLILLILLPGVVGWEANSSSYNFVFTLQDGGGYYEYDTVHSEIDTSNERSFQATFGMQQFKGDSDSFTFVLQPPLSMFNV